MSSIKKEKHDFLDAAERIKGKVVSCSGRLESLNNRNTCIYINMYDQYNRIKKILSY